MKTKLIALFLLFLSCGTVVLNAQTPIINSLRIEGNKHLKTAFIHEMIDAQAGVVLDSALLNKDMQRLRRMSAVFHSSYQIDSAYNLIYTLQENHTLIPLVNFYTTNFGEFAYRLGVIEYNLFGKNISGQVYYQRDIYNSAGFKFSAPNLFSRHWGLAVQAQSLSTLEPVFLDKNLASNAENTESLYRFNTTSAEAIGLCQINFHSQVGLGFNASQETYTYREGATQPGVPLDVVANKATTKFMFTYNQLRYHRQYLSGFKSELNMQYVQSSNPVLPNFLISRNDFFYFKRVGKTGNWASRVRLGIATNSTSPFAPFAADNNINVRGVGNTIDRGTAVMVLNTEYRQTFFQKRGICFQGNVFIDAGAWRQPGGSFEDLRQEENIKLYPGLGFRLMNTKIANAVLRVDYGIGILPNSSEGFVFGIGQYF